MSLIGRTVLALALFVGAVAPAQAVERILRFVSDVQVERDNTLNVTETIRVQAEGKDIRRGILRDFPTIYSRRDGTRVQVGFEVVSVARDGVAENFATEMLSNGVRVRIGHADVMLKTGPHDYVIRYRTTRQIGFFADFDELYWNATGNGWTFAIDSAEARITLPDRVPFRQRAFYTGPQGARGTDATVVTQDAGVIVFRTTKPLPAGHGLTVAAAWPKGVVSEPGAAQYAGWWLRDNLPLVIAAVGALLLLGYYVVAWLLVGRDPRRGTIIPLFGPPDGMSAAAARFVHRMGFDNRVFAAAILDLAVKGHLKLSDSAGSMQVEHRSGGRPLAKAEDETQAALFRGKQRLELEQANHERLSVAKTVLGRCLKEAYEGTLFRKNAGWAGVGAVGWIGVVVAIALAVLTTYGQDMGPGMVFGMVFPLIPIAAGTGMLDAGWRRESGGLFMQIGGAGVAVIFAAVGIGVLLTNAGTWVVAAPALVPLALAVPVALAFTWLKAPSASGRKVMDQIDGFRQYLGVAEEDRLEFLNPPEKTPELFERFLPYAVALDVENSWAQRFAGVLALAGAEAAVASWYAGDRDWTRDPGGFADRIGSTLAATISSASTAPGSSGGSGSSGGGSSGGGGGGGGGSGW